ncbi:WD40-repeat-containing domain protein [Plectosphaerella cucumerina]|uniref:WD40-repeat-containing domain protein n=1 Tax=Plectosphaerella cucumerina TaxID=40658 RepID=A0A8K0T6M7_9PEZI|nr:WD40-repeat-containing domain protein [Plectosphaerella cucumerina]
MQKFQKFRQKVRKLADRSSPRSASPGQSTSAAVSQPVITPEISPTNAGRSSPRTASPAQSTSAAVPQSAAASELSPSTLQERLWNQAYDGVKGDEPKIAEAYERLLSATLQDDRGSPLASNNKDQLTERGRQMERLVEIGLQRTDKAAAAKTKVADGVETVMTVKDLVSKAVQAVPAAAVAWVGVCFALEVLSNSLTESSANRKGLVYVVSRMSWYWNLVDLLLDTDATKELHGLRGRLEDRILRLYRKLLVYQMKSVCIYHQNQGAVFLKDMIKLDDWKSRLDEIKDAEALVLKDSEQYSSQRVQARLRDLAVTADRQYNELQLITSAIQEQTRRLEQIFEDKDDLECMRNLHITDPEKDKARIQDTKGGLLRDSYAWVLKTPNFEEWQTSDCGLLWIRGDPGKGKTMLICGIVDELRRHSTSRPAYFFCQDSNKDLNNATAVLRGLIFTLVRQQPRLISHVREEYDPVGPKLFGGNNVWVAMSKILTAILTDPSLGSTVLVVDALDECGEGRIELLKLIVQSVSCGVKWAVSSRNWPNIQEQLDAADRKVTLRLELNEKLISAAVEAYIGHKVGELAQRKKYNKGLQKEIQQNLIKKADSTFLWVSLVCEELSRASPWNALKTLQGIPSGLDPLYERMMQHIIGSDDEELCTQILAVASIVYRPVSVKELTAVLELPSYFIEDPAALNDLVASCGSFLTLRDNVVSLVHQSAKDFLLRPETINKILSHGVQHQHRAIFSRSVDVLSETLHRDIYQLKEPGATIDTPPPNPDPLDPIQYSLTYWVDHLKDADVSAEPTQLHLQDNSTVHNFLQRKYLYWLEAASLKQSISGAILALQKLQALAVQFSTLHPLSSLGGSSQAQFANPPQLPALIRDALRFVHWCRSGIERTPLQLYASAILHCPRGSLVGILFKRDMFPWIKSPSQMSEDWNACVQTLEGHVDDINAIAFAQDGRLASASDDNTVKIWDTTTGVCVQTLEGHDGWVVAVAFAPDGQLASGSWDKTVKIWDPATGVCVQTLEGHDDYVTAVAFAPDGRLASASEDKTVKIWDPATGGCVQTLEVHEDFFTAVAFALDGRLASAFDTKIQIWDASTEVCSQTLGDHDDFVRAVAFAPDGRLASASDDRTVKVWDATTGLCLQTLEGHEDCVRAVAFAPDGRLVSASENTIRIWDAITGSCLQTLDGHEDCVAAVAFAPDGRLASASFDYTVKIWDLARGGRCIATLEGNSGSVNAVTFAPDGRLVSASDDWTVWVWDATTGVCFQTSARHDYWVDAVIFSPDGRQAVSRSMDDAIKIWDPVRGVCTQAYESGDPRYFVPRWDFDLWTNRDTLALDPRPTHSEPQQGSPRLQQSCSLAMGGDMVWITKDGQDVIWLPFEYRPRMPQAVAVAGQVLAVGCRSGKVMFYNLQ